jgi:HlyD family secretion protein
MTRKPLMALIALAAGLGFLALFHRAGAEDAPAKAAHRPALAVTLTSPALADWPRIIEAGGGLYAWQEAVIAAETGGLRVVDLGVEVGDRVLRGQELARLAQETVTAELAQQDAKVAQVRASLAEAKANADRARTVKDRGAMSDQQSTQYLIAEEGAKANLAAAEAALTMQRIRQGQTRILAVDDGVVSARSATLGMVVQTGTELFRLVRQGRTEWRAEVTAEQLAQVKPGQAAELTLPGGETVTGTVRVAAPTLDANTRYALIYVDVPGDSPARPGMFARGLIRLGQSKALSLPESAVILRDGKSYAFVLGPEDRVAQAKVETGRRAHGRVEILSGLDPDARVVERGGAFLNDGDLVRVETLTLPAPLPQKGEGRGLIRRPAGLGSESETLTAARSVSRVEGVAKAPRPGGERGWGEGRTSQATVSLEPWPLLTEAVAGSCALCDTLPRGDKGGSIRRPAGGGHT